MTLKVFQNGEGSGGEGRERFKRRAGIVEGKDGLQQKTIRIETKSDPIQQTKESGGAMGVVRRGGVFWNGRERGDLVLFHKGRGRGRRRPGESSVTRRGLWGKKRGMNGEEKKRGDELVPGKRGNECSLTGYSKKTVERRV